MKNMKAAAFMVICSFGATGSSIAEVPVNDSKHEKSETETKVCMERARTYKQKTKAPTDGVRGSVKTPNNAGALLRQAGGEGVSGQAFSGNTVGGIDLSVIRSVLGGSYAYKLDSAGQAANALGAVSNATKANNSILSSQGRQIGSSPSIQGAFDQNSSSRLSQSAMWSQSVENANTALNARNQNLMDDAEATSRNTRTMEYDASKARLVGP